MAVLVLLGFWWSLVFAPNKSLSLREGGTRCHPSSPPQELCLENVFLEVFIQCGMQSTSFTSKWPSMSVRSPSVMWYRVLTSPWDGRAGFLRCLSRSANFSVLPSWGAPASAACPSCTSLAFPPVHPSPVVPSAGPAPSRSSVFRVTDAGRWVVVWNSGRGLR